VRCEFTLKASYLREADHLAAQPRSLSHHGSGSVSEPLSKCSAPIEVKYLSYYASFYSHPQGVLKIANIVGARATQWLFNFIIAKLTPIMLSDITYGTFLIFGSCCLIMVLYTIFCVPETKGVPLESIHVLFEGSIIKGATRDTIPRYSRARLLQNGHDDEREEVVAGKDIDEHVENRGRYAGQAKDVAYGPNNAGAS
jgi:hypothetical protein